MENLQPDMGLAIRFFTKAVENPRKSRDAKRPIYDDVEYIQIKFPADPKRDRVANVEEMHYVSHLGTQLTYRERFAPLYDKWKADHDADLIQGTPLAELMSIPESKREELRAQNIRSVEQLAGLTSRAASNLGMGGMGLVQMAQEYLDKANDLSDIASLRARIAELEAGAKPQGEPVIEASLSDEFKDMKDEDLRNILTDAGVTPDGRWGRARLEGEIQSLAKAKENEAA